MTHVLPVTQPGTAESRLRELIKRPMDNTALSQYQRCPKLYDFTMNQHRRGDKLSPALAYGSIWHTIMQYHYRLGGAVDIVEALAEKNWKDHDKPDDYRTLDRAIAEYKKYRRKYGETPEQEDEGQTVGYPDQPLVEVITEVTWIGALYPYTVKLDRFIDVGGQLLIEDHKTSSQDRSDFFKSMEMSNQMMGYAFVAQLFTGRAIAGVRLNRHVVRKNDSLFDRYTIHYSQERLKDWAATYNGWIVRLTNDLQMKAEGNPNAFDHNFNACAGKYGMCGFIGVCASPRRIQQNALEAEFPTVHPWDPTENEDAE